MLIEFKVGNFLSFKETVTFSMVASDIDSQDCDLDYNGVFSINKELKLLKTAAIYGANASGKSNLAKAFGFMKKFVINSSKEMQVTDPIDVEVFRLSSEMEGSPSFFEITFFIDQKIYRYGFQITTEEIVKEWLYCTSKTREFNLFKRNKKDITISKKYFGEGQGLEQRTKQNSLFLSVSAQFNVKLSEQLLEWFADLRVLPGESSSEHFYSNTTLKLLESPKMKQDVIGLIKELDLSISDISIKKMSPEDLPQNMPEEMKRAILSLPNYKYQVQTFHDKYNKKGELIGQEQFDLDESESEGTKKVFYLSLLLLNALRNRQILVIDELDAKLHPLITHKIVQLFNSQEYNPHSAQLIFMTHDTNLLNTSLFGSRLLRRDQVWFTEKNQQGATDLYSLAEYDIKEDSPFEADYIHGKYGAIPFIGGFSKLLENLKND